MLDIAKALNKTGLKMGVLYPSNAEHYFEYGPAYRRNIIEMPFADNGIILRTRQMKGLGLAEPEDYHYSIQTGENFKIWLKTTRIKNQHLLLRERGKNISQGLSYIKKVPTPSDRAPEIAPIP